VIDVLRVAARHRIHGGARHGSFHGEHGVGIGGGLVGALSGKPEHLAHVLVVLLARFFQARIVFEVVVATRHAHAALVKAGDDERGVGEILGRAEAERRRECGVVAALPGAWNGEMKLGNYGRQFCLVAHAIDRREQRLHGLQSARLDAALVHAGGPVVADLLLHGAALGIGLRGLHHGVAQHGVVPQAQV